MDVVGRDEAPPEPAGPEGPPAEKAHVNNAPAARTAAAWSTRTCLEAERMAEVSPGPGYRIRSARSGSSIARSFSIARCSICRTRSLEIPRFRLN